MGGADRNQKLETVSMSMAGPAVWLLAFPAAAQAVEVGCFCTFVFVSTMFLFGVGATLLAKYQLSARIWRLSLKRTTMITILEVILFVIVLFVLQQNYYLRVLAYLPLAFLLNYSLTTASEAVPAERKTPTKRAFLAGCSCLVLPIAVQIMAWLATAISQFITLKEVRI